MQDMYCQLAFAAQENFDLVLQIAHLASGQISMHMNRGTDQLCNSHSGCTRAGAGPDAAAAAAKMSPTAVTSLQHLNEMHAGVLLVGCADGAVRVWRNYTFSGQQRLSTAFQVCELAASLGQCCGLMASVELCMLRDVACSPC